MGFYLRKSVSLGPLRFNLSKSGIGVSAGVKGLRFGSGPRGNYVHMGRHGLYYRATLPSSRPTSPRTAPAASQSAPPSLSNFTPVASGDITAMVDSSSASLLAELNEKRKKWRAWPWVLAAFLVFSGPALGALGGTASTATTVIAAVYLIAAVFAILAAHRFDALRRTTVLLYDLQDESLARYHALHAAFDTAATCQRHWHIEGTSDVTNQKYSGGAHRQFQRTPISLREAAPPLVSTNIAVPCVAAGTNTVYFFPDRVLVLGPSGVGAVAYDALKLETATSSFVERKSVPSDAKVVGQTWTYVNKDGGPDKRFKDNRGIPIAQYETLRITSTSGLNEVFQFSKVGVCQPLIEALTQMKLTAAYLLKGDVTPEVVRAEPTPSPPAQTAQSQDRTSRKWAEYEKEFPYESAKPVDERLPRGGPTVSGGLPSLGKRR